MHHEMILYCLTNFLYEFDHGKSTLNNSALKFAAEEEALYLTWKQASRDFFYRGRFGIGVLNYILNVT